MVEEFGSFLGKPYTSKVENELFEIRAKGVEGIGRSFFCTTKDKKIVILHSFIKKTQKIPLKEIKLLERD